MDASKLHAFARRRLADDPATCPVAARDAALMLTWLAALEVEADLDEAEVDALLAASRRDDRAAAASAFRAASGAKPRPTAAPTDSDEEE